MAFQVTILPEARIQWKGLSARERRIVHEAVETRLSHQPKTPTKAIKRLRPNPFAEFELRVGDLRVLDNVEGLEVVILLIGRKVGNKLMASGEEFNEHQDDPAP